MNPTPTDPREEKPKLPYTFKTFKGHCENCETPFEIGGLILDEEKVQSTNSKLAAEVERQNVILLSHSKAVGEFACGAPSVPDALRKLAADLKNALDGQEYYKNEADVAAERLAKLAAEIAELRDWKESAMSVMPPYQEIGEALGLTIGQSVHDKILPGIHALRAELKKARQALFQTEKRLDDKLRTALAELDAARKERDAYQNDGRIGGAAAAYERVCKSLGLTGDLLGYFQRLSADRDTALAAKDAAIAAIEAAPHEKLCYSIIGWPKPAKCDCWKAAALTPAPTQEPPAGGVTITLPRSRVDLALKILRGDDRDILESKASLVALLSPTGDDDGLFDNIPDFQPPAISTEKKGGSECKQP